MQDLLTATIVAIAILFTVSATADFVAGLIKLWKSAGSQAQPQVSANAVIEQSPSAPKLEAEVTPDPWTLATSEQATLPAEQIVKQQMLLPPARVQFVTLQWALSNLPPVETFIVEVPDAIAMAKSRSPKVAPVIELATQKQLESCSIRRLKALARQIKLRGYGSMRLTELAAALEGKVAAHQLVA